MNRRGLFARLAALLAAPLIAKLPAAEAAAPALPVGGIVTPNPAFIGGWWTNNAQGYVTTCTPLPAMGPVTNTTNSRVWMRQWNQRPPDEEGALVA